MSKLYNIKHGINYTKTSNTYKSNLALVNKETLLHIANLFGIKLPKSHTKEKMTETISAFVLSNPEKTLAKLSVKELEVLRDFVKVGPDTHVDRPSRKFYNMMRNLLLVSTYHNKKERRLYFLLPDELRVRFAPLLKKAMEEAKEFEKEQKSAASNASTINIEDPICLDDDNDDDEDYDDVDVYDDIEALLESLNAESFFNSFDQRESSRSEKPALKFPTYKYSCSVDLMEAIRNLSYEKKADVCKAYFQMSTNHQVGEHTIYSLRFEEDYTMMLSADEDYKPYYISCCINDLDNAITEIDYFDPMTFFTIAGELEKIIHPAD